MENINCLYNKYSAILVLFACSIVKDQSEAKDIVQETLIYFWENQLTAGTNIKSLLFTAVKNRCLNSIRNHKVRYQRYKQAPIPENEPPIQIKEKGNIVKEIVSEITKIAPLSAKAVELAYFQQLSRNEIAEKMGISPNTVKNQLMRALRIARENFNSKIIYNE